MLSTLYTLVDRLFPSIAYNFSKRWFEFLSSRDSGRHMLFMNYGYEAEQPVPLSEADEPDRYSIQLYHRVAGGVDLSGLDVLEVGSGRGGGASYVRRRLGPARVVGVDLAESAVDFCRGHYAVPGLTFQRGDAEALAFPDGSFDAVINIESSSCYERPERFFAEVGRVLRPGGHFLYADVRARDGFPEWERQLAASGLEELEREDITERVLAALDRDSGRRRRLIVAMVPWGLRRVFTEFAAVPGSKYFYEAMIRGEKVYRRHVYRKPN
ncbi:MAG TPA: class I SAM-dependent methyltransferase [Anaerolineales bacterium]|nr:class I SAM-dependent methyltransferase [Anaerolineales bacterium]